MTKLRTLKLLEGGEVSINPNMVVSVYEGDIIPITGKASTCVMVQPGIIYNIAMAFEVFIKDYGNWGEIWGEWSH